MGIGLGRGEASLDIQRLRNSLRPVTRHPNLSSMRYLIPPLAVVLVAITLPNDPIALVVYLAIASYSVFLATNLFQNASAPMRRQVLIGSGIALFLVLGIVLYQRVR